MSTQPPTDSGEWHQINGFLDHLRDAVEAKAAGLSDAALGHTIGTSHISIGGILTHLAFIEDYWFGYVWTGREPSDPWPGAPWEDDPDADWGMAARLTAAEALALWRTAADRSRWEARRCRLDETSARPLVEGPVTKRWILLRMIEEYARHCGQAEMLREAIASAASEPSSAPR